MTARKLLTLVCLLVTAMISLPNSALAIEIPGKRSRKAEPVRTERPTSPARTESKISNITTVSLSGRVVTPNGRPIKNAKIILMDLDGATQVTVSGGLGFYAITGIVPGRTYVLGVFHKRYIFASPTQTLEINSDQNNVILLGEENW